MQNPSFTTVGLPKQKHSRNETYHLSKEGFVLTASRSKNLRTDKNSQSLTQAYATPVVACVQSNTVLQQSFSHQKTASLSTYGNSLGSSGGVTQKRVTLTTGSKRKSRGSLSVSKQFMPSTINGTGRKPTHARSSKGNLSLLSSLTSQQKAKALQSQHSMMTKP